MNSLLHPEQSFLHAAGLQLQREEVRAAHAIAPTVRCAWCDAEQGRKPDVRVLESHGICTRHLAGLKTNLEAQRRRSVAPTGE